MSNKILYVGMDVHQATISMAAMNAAGWIVSEAIIETKTEAVRDFIKTLRGEVHITFEEGTQAAWLYDLLSPLVEEVIVCNPRHNKLLHSGNKNDQVDARKLAELLRHGSLRAVYHGEHGTRTLKELVRCYECLVEDITRVKNRRESDLSSAGDCQPWQSALSGQPAPSVVTATGRAGSQMPSRKFVPAT